MCSRLLLPNQFRLLWWRLLPLRPRFPKPSATSTLLPAYRHNRPIDASASTEIAFAPVCGSGVVSAIPTPAIQLFNRGCTKKVPYSILTIPQGSTFTSQSPDLTCTTIGQSGDKMQITCQAQNPYSYGLKVCSPPPTSIASVSPGQCQQGTNYDTANQCCAVPQPDAGCTVYQVDLKTCAQ